MDPSYLAQVTFACLLAICSCFGNTTACIALKLSPVPKCPYFINMLVLELVAIIVGPGAYLVTVFFDPVWLREETSACIVAKVLQKFSLFGSLLSLAFMSWSHCHKKEFPQKKIVMAFSILSTWFLPAITLLCSFLVQKSHFLDTPWFMCFSPTTSNMDGFLFFDIFIVIIAASVHLFCLWLAFSSIMSKNTYFMLDQWKRHKREITVNDPECSTFHQSYSESTSVSLDKIFNAFPVKKLSGGQISIFNASRSWTVSHQADCHKPETGEVKTENGRPKPNSDPNDVFYDNDKSEISSLEVGVVKKRHSTECDSVFGDLAEACVSSSEQSDAYKSSVESMKSESSLDELESSSRTSCSFGHTFTPGAASVCKIASIGNEGVSNTSNATTTSTNSAINHSCPIAPIEASFPVPSSNLTHHETSHFPSGSSRNTISPIKNRQQVSLSPFGHNPNSAGTYNVHSFYSPVLNTAPWYYSTSPCYSPYPTTLGFGEIRKYKRARFISPITLDFAKTDRTVREFRKLVLAATCISVIGWLLFSIVLIFNIVGLVLPEEVLRLSTMALFVKSAMTPVLYGVCFSQHRWACKKYMKFRLPLNPKKKKKCSLDINDVAVIGAYLAQDECGIQLEKCSRSSL